MFPMLSKIRKIKKKLVEFLGLSVNEDFVNNSIKYYQYHLIILFRILNIASIIIFNTSLRYFHLG